MHPPLNQRRRPAAWPSLVAAATLVLAGHMAAAGETTVAHSEQDIACLALNVYHEARNQPPEGQLAVAHVTLNRLAESPAPTTLCEVVYRPGVFSWTSDPELVDSPPAEAAAWELAQRIAREAIADRRADPVAGSTFFHAVSVSPYWASRFVRVRQIGDHIFYARAVPSLEAPRRSRPAEILLPK